MDRYLEHARIIHFHHAGKPRVFISSADWMPRNLDKRLELMIPVEDETCRDRLIDILALHLADNCSSWTLQPDGSYTRRQPTAAEAARSSQEACHRLAAMA